MLMPTILLTRRARAAMYIHEKPGFHGRFKRSDRLIGTAFVPLPQKEIADASSQMIGCKCSSIGFAIEDGKSFLFHLSRAYTTFFIHQFPPVNKNRSHTVELTRRRE